MDTFEAIFMRYRGPLVWYLIKNYELDEETADDIVQSTMIDTWRTGKYAQLTQKRLMDYLYTSIRNRYISWWRLQKTERKNKKGLLDISEVAEDPDQDPHWLMAHFIAACYRLIEDFSPLQRRTIELSLEGKTLQEMAEDMGITPVLCSTYRSRAIQKLRESLMTPRQMATAVYAHGMKATPKDSYEERTATKAKRKQKALQSKNNGQTDT